MGIFDCVFFDGGIGCSGGCRGGGSGGDFYKGCGGGCRIVVVSGVVLNGGFREGEGFEIFVDVEFCIVVGSFVGVGEFDERIRGVVVVVSYFDLNVGDEVFGLVDVGLVNV